MAGVAGRSGQLASELTGVSASATATSLSTSARASPRKLKSSNGVSNGGSLKKASNKNAQKSSKTAANTSGKGKESSAGMQKLDHHAPAPLLDSGTGCLACGKDDDHPNILLCERCNDEYHTYCLRPALNSIPEGDWFCGK